MSKVVFADGQTQIDYVLVYVKNLSIPSAKYEAISKVRKKFIRVLIKNYKIQIEEVSLLQRKKHMQTLKLKNFICSLLFLFKRIVKTKNKEIGFYLMHLPWNVLVSEVERLKLKIPLKVITNL